MEINLNKDRTNAIDVKAIGLKHFKLLCENTKERIQILNKHIETPDIFNQW